MEIEIESENKKDERKTHQVGRPGGGGTSTRLPDGILLSTSEQHGI